MTEPGGIPGTDQSVTVVPEEVRTVGNFVYGLAETLRDAVDSAASDVDALTRASWTGHAADAFADGWNDIRTGSAQIIAALTGMAEKLGVTADTFSVQDESRASEFAGALSLDLP
ncbi:WXG100 family type VII secretion target [Nocardia thailandica]|uniref:WXG100 family type VII secretion target n=1 Tax=Nocardia thailandica TaxID=257275 RepID=UPI0005BBCEE7|nr:WXG100 family type VII secretion target [Nocardia thailandica]